MIFPLWSSLSVLWLLKQPATRVAFRMLLEGMEWNDVDWKGKENHGGVLDGMSSGIPSDISCFKTMSFAAFIILLST